MAQEDKGLVLRGMLLLALIGVLVTFVLVIIFWNTPQPRATSEPAADVLVPAVIMPSASTFPASVPWAAIYELSARAPSIPGWEVRYNAATTLARRGSSNVPWPHIREMLDEKQQMRNYRVRRADGREVVDEAAARANMISALRALAAWHEKKAGTKMDVSTELRDIYTVVDQLTASPFGELKIQAEKAREKFFR